MTYDMSLVKDILLGEDNFLKWEQQLKELVQIIEQKSQQAKISLLASIIVVKTPFTSDIGPFRLCGEYDIDSRRIYINPELSEEKKQKTLDHELGHVYIWDKIGYKAYNFLYDLGYLFFISDDKTTIKNIGRQYYSWYFFPVMAEYLAIITARDMGISIPFEEKNAENQD